jgi:hypothetical protein
MNHLDVGVDKGFSKTNLAVARADGRLLLEARLEHFDQSRKPPITDERLLYLIAQYLIPFKGSPLSLSSSAVVSSHPAASLTVCVARVSISRRSKYSPMSTPTMG